MTLAVTDAGIIKQWEAKVRRWIAQGRTREQIIYDMTAANWKYADAEQIVRKGAWREKRKWIVTMIVCAVFAFLGVGLSIATLRNPNGGVFYVPLASIIGFVYSLVRLVKIKA